MKSLQIIDFIVYFIFFEGKVLTWIYTDEFEE